MGAGVSHHWSPELGDHRRLRLDLGGDGRKQLLRRRPIQRVMGNTVQRSTDPAPAPMRRQALQSSVATEGRPMAADRSRASRARAITG